MVSLMVKYPVQQVQGEKQEQEITVFTSEMPLSLQDECIAMLWRKKENTQNKYSE